MQLPGDLGLGERVPVGSARRGDHDPRTRERYRLDVLPQRASVIPQRNVRSSRERRRTRKRHPRDTRHGQHRPRTQPVLQEPTTRENDSMAPPPQTPTRVKRSISTSGSQHQRPRSPTPSRRTCEALTDDLDAEHGNGDCGLETVLRRTSSHIYNDARASPRRLVGDGRCRLGTCSVSRRVDLRSVHSSLLQARLPFRGRCAVSSGCIDAVRVRRPAASSAAPSDSRGRSNRRRR